MRRLFLIPVAIALVAAVWLWGFGGADRLGVMASSGQRDVQNAMARALRSLKAGESGALMALWSMCFAYGFFHAAGPGHGKLVIGGYGLGRRVPMGRLTGLAIASSLAQAATAVALVYAGIFALGWNRERMQGLADGAMNTLSTVLIAGIGVWLLLRGGRALWRAGLPGLFATPATLAVQVTGHGHGHDHGHGNGHGHGHVHPTNGHCDTCGHAHGPTIDQAAAVRSWRDAAIVVGSIAARPCTGALFLLVLTWRLGIDWAGIVGAFVMGLGTASITVLVAIASVSVRESALAQVAAGPGVARMLALIETLAGALVLAVALQLLLRGI